MKIILICQADPAFKWEKRYTASGFEQAVQTANDQGIEDAAVQKNSAFAYRVYIGDSKAARDTAARLLQLSEAPVSSPVLHNIIWKAFRITDRMLPLRLWRAMGFLQWAAGAGRQTESLKDTVLRLIHFTNDLEKEDRDCIVIGGRLILTLLKAILRFRGYCLEGGELIPQPMDRIRATKQSQHCGGCHHNCLLSAPKCQIGQNKARERANK